tara:strand:+ start:239 stop:724 length:486 start_codon:yes stop_codon:yes gene_type:complete
MEAANKKVTLEVLIFSVLSFIATKAITLFYIALHNNFEEEQWSYSLIFRNMHIEKTWSMLVSPVILAPIIETLVFCVLLFKVSARLRFHGYVFVFLSASLFAPYHLTRDGAGEYTLAYTFIGGLIFASFYLRRIKYSGSEMKAFALTSMVHAIYNLLVTYI